MLLKVFSDCGSHHLKISTKQRLVKDWGDGEAGKKSTCCAGFTVDPQWKENLWSLRANRLTCVPHTITINKKLLYFLKEHFGEWIKSFPKHAQLVKTGLVFICVLIKTRFVFICVYVWCMYVWGIHIYVHVHIHACMQRPEKTIRCSILSLSYIIP